MENSAPKKKIARTEKEQESLKQEIIDTARELFASRGSNGFSTRALAKRLNMSQGNLYNYFESKRELWIAIREQDFKKLKKEMEEIVITHQGEFSVLIKKLFEYYLDFAYKEKRRFQIMFMIPAPPSKKVGPIEQKYEVIDPLDVVRKILQKGIDNGDVKKQDVNSLALYIYSLAQGATFVERDLRITKKIFEPIDQNPAEDAIQKYRAYLIQKILNQLK
ncbi:MAG: TetR/AcrR family transcriptional regulator [Candidatus Hermodarchaeota archaeon]